MNTQTPQPPFRGKAMWQCPNCKRNLTMINCIKKKYSYCPKCGTAIDWAGIKSEPRTYEGQEIIITWEGTIKKSRQIL